VTASDLHYEITNTCELSTVFMNIFTNLIYRNISNSLAHVAIQKVNLNIAL